MLNKLVLINDKNRVKSVDDSTQQYNVNNDKTTTPTYMPEIPFHDV